MDEAGSERPRIKISPRESGEVSNPRIRISSNRPSEQAVRMPRFIRDIPNLPEQEAISVRTRDDLARVVESPLLPAAQVLYDFNIRTIDSSANRQDVGNEAWLTIDFDSLSAENQQIAQELLGEPYQGRKSIVTGEYGPKRVQIRLPIAENATEQEIARRALELARNFKRQPLTWGILTPEEVEGREDLFYYDKESNKYYLSKEHYLKAKGLSFKVESK